MIHNFFRAKDSTRAHFKSEALQLQVESLEPPMMLSTVQIIAAGTTNQEVIDLQIGGQNVASYSNLGSGAFSGQFQTRTFKSEHEVLKEASSFV